MIDVGMILELRAKEQRTYMDDNSHGRFGKRDNKHFTPNIDPPLPGHTGNGSMNL